MTLKDKIALALDHLKKRDVSFFEVFALGTDVIRAEAKEGKVHSLERAYEAGLSIRVLLDGALGFAYGREANAELIEAAIVSARHQFKDKHNHIPDVRAAYQILDIFDARIAGSSPDECIAKAVELEASAREYDQKVQQIRKASFSRGIAELRIVNSSGIDVAGKSTSCTASIMVKAREHDDMQAGYEFDISHDWAGINVQEVGRNAARKAIAMLGARQIQTMRIPVTFDNASTAELLEILAQAFHGENVLKGKSYLKNKLGKQCFSSTISLVDNPLDTRASDAMSFDGEGIPSRRTVLVENGIVRSFVYDSYWGAVAGKSSTGNSIRGSYRSTPTLGLRHLCLIPGEHIAQPLREMRKLLNVTDIMGLHTADPISGEFSIGVNGFLFEKGAELFPVREAAIAGNIYEMFSRVLAVGNDVRGFGRVSAPSLLVDAMDISSK